MKVFINPGHAPGGIPDPGAINPITGTRESDIAAKAGRMLAGYLEAAGVEVNALQSDDLDEVCAASNEWGADIFVSIHCNASIAHNAQGTETYYKSFNGQRLAGFIQSQIIRSVDTVDRGSKHEDRLWVLNNTDAVAVLVELAFIDQMDDLKLLETDLDKIVRAIARGITDYLIS